MSCYYKVILFLTLIIAWALIGLGAWSIQEERCPVQPSLPLWMVLAGCLLLLMSALLGWKEYSNSNSVVRKKTILGYIGWALCGGLCLLFGYLIWLAVWIAGTYLSIVTWQSLRVVHQWSENSLDNTTTFVRSCHLATLAGAGLPILIIWIISVSLCVKGFISVVAVHRREYGKVQLDEDAEAG